MTSPPVISPRPTTHAQPHAREKADACTLVIFGALGDLARRKLLPAIYQLMKEHLVDEHFAVLGIGRDETQTDDTFRAEMKQALDASDEVKNLVNALWEQLCGRLYFV